MSGWTGEKWQADGFEIGDSDGEPLKLEEGLPDDEPLDEEGDLDE